MPIGAKDIPSIVSFAEANAIDYAVVTPDDPLVLGCVDALEEIGVPCFGPRAEAAIIEGSKVFAKDLMKKYGIPTARYESFDRPEEALRYLETAPLPTVIKADGLALGKGVIIAQTREEARAGRPRDDGEPQVRQERREAGHRGISGGSRGLRPGLYRRQDHRPHGLLHGPQVRL